MITIFNGRKRTARAGEADIYIQVSVALRNELYRFWNGRNANAYVVFSAIALHANQDGWAWPSFELLKRETGISHTKTLRAALRHLRGLEIDHQPVLHLYQRGVDGLHKGYAFHIFPAAGGAQAVPDHLGRLLPWEPEADEPEGSPGYIHETPLDEPPGHETPLEAPPKQNQTLKHNHLNAAPAAATALRAIHIAVPPAANQRHRNDYTETCPYCGPAVPITQEEDTCSSCGTAVVWAGSALADKRAKARRRAELDAAAKARWEQETYLTHLTGEIMGLARADSIGHGHGFRITYNRDTREEQRLADYERAFGTTVLRQLAHEARKKAKGRGMIVTLLNTLETYRPLQAQRATPASEAGKVWDDDYYKD
jgi:hypothetical protein